MAWSFIALGSNLDQPLSQLQRAVKSIGAMRGSQILALSSVYSSAAVGPGQQPDYLNAALQLETDLSPMQLLDQLQHIENQQGRLRNIRWQARTLDLDILLYDQLQIDNDRLQVPHPRMAQRNFVLFPLAEIYEGNRLLPIGIELDTLVARCPQEGIKKTALALTSGNLNQGVKHPDEQ